MVLALLAVLGASAAEPRPTEPFRAEHDVLETELDAVAARVGALPALAPGAQGAEMRGIDELDAMARAPNPDATAFSRRADNLLGLLRAHFEAEEDVLLPILDRGMSAEEFRREVLEAEKEPE